MSNETTHHLISFQGVNSKLITFKEVQTMSDHYVIDSIFIMNAPVNTFYFAELILNNACSTTTFNGKISRDLIPLTPTGIANMFAYVNSNEVKKNLNGQNIEFISLSIKDNNLNNVAVGGAFTAVMNLRLYDCNHKK